MWSSYFCDRDRNLNFSLINQFLQVFSFAFAGFAYKYVAGLYLFVGFDITKEIQIILI